MSNQNQEEDNMKQLSEQEAINFYEQKLYEKMSDKEKAIFQLTQDRLCMPFEVFHEAVEKTLGRPVYTHELALDRDGLLEELNGEAEPPTIQEIIDLIPRDKQVIVAIH